MRKELTCYVQTNEEGEEVKVQRVTDDPQYYMLTLGQNRMVVNVAELMDAIGAIDHFSTMFDEERRVAENKAKAPPTVVVNVPEAKPKKGKKVALEDEGAIMLEAQTRSGPTASELALERQTQHMKGESLVMVEKKVNE